MLKVTSQLWGLVKESHSGRGQQWEAGLGSAAWLYDGSAIMLPALTWQGASLLRSLLSHQVLEGLTKAIFCFFHLKPYCTLPITYGRVSSANEWATMRFWGVWLERPLNRKSEDICGKKRTHVFFTEEEKVWDLHDLNWLFQLLKGIMVSMVVSPKDISTRNLWILPYLGKGSLQM